MNLCIMPKPCGILFTTVDEKKEYISTSVSNALDEMKLLINTLLPNSELSEICKICNPHEYVFSNMEITVPPVGKVNPPSNLYYELYEIFNTFGLFKKMPKIALYIGDDNDNTVKILFNQAVDVIQQPVYDPNYPGFKMVDVIICAQLSIALTVLTALNKGGNIIIKLTNIYDKTDANILYMLSILFEKTILIKPSVINVLSSDIFILGISYLDNYAKYVKINVSSISTPTYFLCKIEEFNAVNGHKQLDAYEQVINLFFNKNKNSKLDLIKKTNIQKSILWCDKQNVPHNKCGYKTNIFLDNMS